VDISFYRDDFALRAGGSASPVVHATELEFSVDGRTIVINKLGRSPLPGDPRPCAFSFGKN